MNLLDFLLIGDVVPDSEPDRSMSYGPDLSLWANLPRPEAGSEQVDGLSRRVGQLNLAVAGLIRLLVRQGAVKPAELSALMREIDLEDGSADGQLAEPKPRVPEWCPKCEAKTAPRKTYCVFCGERFQQLPGPQ